MSISDIKERKTEEKIWLVVTGLTALFGGIYETFSHGVFSGFMVFAFLIPLCAGLLLTFVFEQMPEPFQIGGIWKKLLHSGTAVLTVGCIMKGILDIYGTTNRLMPVYLYAGILLWALALGGYLNQIRKYRKMIRL